MTFYSFQKLRRRDASGNTIFINPNKDWYNPDEVQAALDDGTFDTVSIDLHCVNTPDPNHPNSNGAAASPSGQLTILIANPHAVQEMLDMIKKTEACGRKNGSHSTTEFYVDLYPAPAED
jgi:hypothetical protein